MEPVSSVNCGVPVTVTFSENVTRKSITFPVLYEPLAVLEETDKTVGEVLSDVYGVSVLQVTPVLLTVFDFPLESDANVALALEFNKRLLPVWATIGL